MMAAVRLLVTLQTDEEQLEAVIYKYIYIYIERERERELHNLYRYARKKERCLLRIKE